MARPNSIAWSCPPAVPRLTPAAAAAAAETRIARVAPMPDDQRHAGQGSPGVQDGVPPIQAHGEQQKQIKRGISEAAGIRAKPEQRQNIRARQPKAASARAKATKIESRPNRMVPVVVFRNLQHGCPGFASAGEAFIATRSSITRNVRMKSQLTARFEPTCAIRRICQIISTASRIVISQQFYRTWHLDSFRLKRSGIRLGS